MPEAKSPLLLLANHIDAAGYELVVLHEENWESLTFSTVISNSRCTLLPALSDGSAI